VAWGSGPGWGKRAESESDDETASSSSTEEADEPKKPSNPPLSVAEPKRSVEVAQPVQLPEAAAQQDAIPSALGIEWIDNEAKLNACVRSLQKNLFEQFKEKKSLQENRIGVIALRCEGDGRIAPVPVVSVATRTSAYVIEGSLLRSAIASSGLARLLEDPKVGKLMYDCRRDADALQHHYDIALAGVEDLQLLELMVRTEPWDRASLHGLPEIRPGAHADIFSLRNLAQACSYFNVPFSREAFDSISRPMKAANLRIAASSSQVLFALLDQLRCPLALRPSLLSSSALYADYFRTRSDAFVARGNYLSDHDFLPFGVLPGVPAAQSPAFLCAGCERALEVARERDSARRPWCGLCLALTKRREEPRPEVALQ